LVLKMNFSIFIPDILVPGITESRNAANAALPATVPDPNHQGDGEPEQIPNPAIFSTNAAYLSFALAPIAESWCEIFKVGKYTPTIPDAVLQSGLQTLQQAAPGISEQEATLALEQIYNLAISNTPALSPPPAAGPEPDFVTFSEALLTENGFKAVWESVLQINPMLATAITTYLETFRTQGDWSQYLNSLGKSIVLLGTNAEQQYIVSELIGLSQRCHLPGDFIAALQAIIPQSPPPE
jgi:hypothetical protein